MQVDHNHTHKVMALLQLSDSELMGRLQDSLEKLGIPANEGDVLNLEALPKAGNGAKT